MERHDISLPKPFSNLDYCKEFQSVDVWLTSDKCTKKSIVVLLGPFVLIKTQKTYSHMILAVNYIARDCFAENKKTVSLDSILSRPSIVFVFGSENDKTSFIRRFYMGGGYFNAYAKQLSRTSITLNGPLTGRFGGRLHECHCVLQNNMLLEFTFQVHAMEEDGVMNCLYEARLQQNCEIETVIGHPFGYKTEDSWCFKIVNEEGEVAFFNAGDILNAMHWILCLHAWKVHANLPRAVQDAEETMEVSITLEDIDTPNQQDDVTLKPLPKQPQSPIPMPRKNVFSVDQETPKKRHKSRDFIRDVEVLSPFKTQCAVRVESQSPVELGLKLECERREISSRRRGKFPVRVPSKTPLVLPVGADIIDMQIKDAISKLDVNQPEDFSVFATTECRCIDDIVADTIRKHEQSRQTGIDEIIPVEKFPYFDLGLMKRAMQPVRPIIDDLAQVIQEIQVQQEQVVRKGAPAKRLCFLVSVVFMNGFRSDFLSAIRELVEKVPGLRDICDSVSHYQNMSSLVSAFSALLINTHALLPVLRVAIRDGVWQSTHYAKSAYMNDDETIETMFYMLSPLMNVLEFDLDCSIDVISSAFPEDRQKFLSEAPYMYKELANISNENDLLRVATYQFFAGGKPCWAFFSEFADAFSSVPECQALVSSIKKAKWKIDDFEKIQTVLTSSIKEKRLHVDFGLMIINQQLVKKHFPPDSSLCDMFRASFVISALAHAMI